MKLRALVLLLFAPLFLGAKCATVPVDRAMAAIEAGDYTALIEGCGNQLVPGYTYCRVFEGDDASGNLVFVAPKTECLDPNGCASFKVYHPVNGLVYGGTIPKGQTRSEVPWRALLGRVTFELSDIGFWPFTYEIKWLDGEGKEQVAYSQGEIRVRVIHKKTCNELGGCAYYEPLQNSPSDPAFAWEWKEGKVEVKMTTGARAYVSREP